MKITLLTYGSQGDVQPFVELGKGLAATGHQVTLAAPRNYERLLMGAQITFVAFPGDPRIMVQDLVNQAGSSWWRMIRAMSSFVLPLGVEVSQIARQACLDAELIIHSFLLTNTGYEIARENGIPDISVQTFPVFTSTGAFPAPAAPDLPLGSLYRRLTHEFVTQTFWQGSRLIYHWLRKENSQLPPLTNWPFDRRNDRQTPILYAFSPSVIPRPGDWRENAHITGYMFPADNNNWVPDPQLADFIENGPPPIAVAFGSTSTAKLDRLLRKIVEALDISNQRGIIVGKKPAGLECAGIFWQAEYIPYDWLFKRSAGVIHHGGAGTTGEALRAGVPNIILPFTSDQPFWGRQVCKLGAGPKPIPAKQMLTADLARSISLVISDQEIKANAKHIGKLLRGEDGVQEAVRIIHDLLNSIQA